MSEVMRMMVEFHRGYELPMAAMPVDPKTLSGELVQLRLDLHMEESEELVKAAWHERDLIGVVDALADIVYVAYGTALTYGIDLDAVLREVHRSNMTKLDENGRPLKREDGKVIKSDRYQKPDLKRVLLEQQPLW
jgi:predicted HAD superfamily Cof-like phosphohydrolase